MAQTSARRTVLVPLLLALGACDGTTPVADAGPDTSTDAYLAPVPVITLPEGDVRGLRGRGSWDYLGIPYAEPPVGPLRFAPPVAHPGWDEPIGPIRVPPTCPQTAIGLAGGNEDCLVVNVHVPMERPESAPVVVWIHGGAFLVGSGISLDSATMGDLMAREQDVIVVSINYRLGPFGFFRYPGVAEGNQGFLDQQLALRWVRGHIAAFGGDPDDVTIVGESAGGLSVCLHLIAPASAGLFHRAIAQSGLCDSYLPSAAEAEEAGATLVEALGCDGSGDVGACARDAEIAALFEAAGPAADLTVLLSGTAFRPFWPHIDGTVIPGSFRSVVTAGDHASVPTILGWTRDEGTLFVGLAEDAGTPADSAAYDRAVADFAARDGIEESALRAAYPLADFADPGAAIAEMVGDAELVCPSRRAAQLLSAAGTEVHVYRFDHDEALFQLELPRALGAFHSADIQFVFGHPVGVPRFTTTQEPIYRAMQGAWGAFARGDALDGPLGMPWPAFEAPTESMIVFDDTLTAATALDAEACAIWAP